MSRSEKRITLNRKRVSRSILGENNFKKFRAINIDKSVIFLTGGLGDIFAIESFLTDEIRAKITTICYATLKSKWISEIWRDLPNYPLLVNHQVVWNDFNRFWCFMNLSDCIFRMNKEKIQCPPILRRAVDFSITPFFDRIRRRDVEYTYSSFLKHSLAHIDHISLPDSYITICPYSTDKRIASRDFDDFDWKECLNLIDSLGVKGVVLNSGRDRVPIHPNLLDYSNNTNLKESVEIMKKSIGYVGVDSAFSVLAAKLFDKNLMIKSNNDHCYNNAECYFAPQTSFDFLVRKIEGSWTR